MKKVLVFGTFDGLHLGHLNFFKQASALGERLYVVIARDETVKKVKGHSADNTEQQRLSAVNALNNVTKAVLGSLKDKYKVIEKIRPDIIALGYDQQAFTEKLSSELNKRNIKAEIVRLKPYKPDIYKSSLLRKQKKT